MSTDNHTPISSTAALTAANLNAPLSELDSAIGALGRTDIGCRVYRVSALSVTLSVETTIEWDTEAYDTDTMHDNATNPERVTAQTAGKYLVTAQVRFSGGLTTRPKIRVYKNGVSAGNEIAIQELGNGFSVNVCAHVNLSASDYLATTIFHSSGTDRNLSTGSGRTFIAVQKIG